MNSRSPTTSAASRMRSIPASLCSSSGRLKAMFSLIVPAKRNGSWSTRPIWRRRERWVTERTSCRPPAPAPAWTS